MTGESVSRTASLYNTKKRKGRLGVSKTTFFTNYVLNDVNDPFVPGTTVPRLRLLRLAPKATAVFDREVDEFIQALRAWRDAGCAVRAKGEDSSRKSSASQISRGRVAQAVT